MVAGRAGAGFGTIVVVVFANMQFFLVYSSIHDIRMQSWLDFLTK